MVKLVSPPVPVVPDKARDIVDDQLKIIRQGNAPRRRIAEELVTKTTLDACNELWLVSVTLLLDMIRGGLHWSVHLTGTAYPTNLANDLLCEADVAFKAFCEAICHAISNFYPVEQYPVPAMGAFSYFASSQ